MAKKKQSEYVATKTTMVLRQRIATTGEEKVKLEKTVARGRGSKAPLPMPSVKSKKAIHDIKSTRVLRPRIQEAKGEKLVIVDEKAKGKMPVEVNEKTDGKKTVASGNAVKSGTATKRKLVADKGNSEVAGSRGKKLKAVMNNNEIDKGAATESTRVLRSNCAKRGDESGKKNAKKEYAKILKKNHLAERKKTNIVVTDSVFPSEIIMEILSWLPLKFLGAPMVVCKQWYALIQDRHYIEKHMRRNLSYIESEARQGYEKVDDCDGLQLEINTSTQKYRIRNPDTKQFLELPDPHSGSHCIFFSYVPLTHDYKIVSVYDDENRIECCEILTVENGELSWRLLKMPTRDYLGRNRKELLIIPTGDAVHCVRVIASGDDMVEEVVSLDLGTEQFSVTNLPKGQNKSWEKVWHMNFKGKLALVDIVGAKLCVLVLENYKQQRWGEKESFVTLELIKILEDEYGPILPWAVDQSEKLWFLAKDTNKLMYYDGKTKSVGSDYGYQHSLVRLKGMQPE